MPTPPLSDMANYSCNYMTTHLWVHVQRHVAHLPFGAGDEEAAIPQSLLPGCFTLVLVPALAGLPSTPNP